MTDLEMTRLCAEAMGYRTAEWDDERGLWCHLQAQHGVWYNPLHDDAQAMALVKRFNLDITAPSYPMADGATWGVRRNSKANHPGWWDADLNRAIVECCARMQLAKAKL